MTFAFRLSPSSTVLFSRLGLLLAFMLIPGPSLLAQGFNTFNGRNHPELDWQQAETAHFKIMYPAHLAGIETEAAPIAEATYEALSQNLDVTFDQKIRVYFSDEDEILNGFAVSPLGFTNIWVHVNDVATTWSGNVKWLRTVLSHELTHLFHGEAVKSRVGILSYFLGDPMPSFWAEGLAQYESEFWDANRGDRWLRTAILDDRLSYEDGQSAWNGRLLYSVGNSQLRYFAEQYGDSTLTKILKHRKKTGPIRHHDFYTAFEDVTGEGFRDFYDAWRRHMNVYYNTMAGQMENTDSLEAAPLKIPGQYFYDIRYSPDTSFTAVLSLTSVSRPVTRLHIVNSKTRKSKIIADGGIQAPVSWSPDGNSLVFARRTRSRKGSILNDLFLVSRNGKKTRRLTKSRRASSPSFSPDGKQIAFIGSFRGTANVFLLDLASGRETQLTSFEGDVQLASIEWHPVTNKLVIGRFDADGSRDVMLLDPETARLDLLTLDTADEQFPIWSPDGKQIAITSLQDNVPNVFIIDVNSKSKRRLTNLITGARVHDWLPADSTHPAGSLIVTTSSSKQRDQAFQIHADRVPFIQDISIPESYNRWTTHRPASEIPSVLPDTPEIITKRSTYKAAKNLVHLFSFGVPFYNNSDDWGLFGVTSWTEPLGHHALGISAAASFPESKKNSFLLASYINNQLRPTTTFSAYSLLPTATAYGNTYLIDGITGGEVSVDWPLDIAVKPYTSTRFQVKLQYASVKQLNEDNNLPSGADMPQEGEKAEMLIGITRKKQRPYSGNVVHPLDGLGISVQLAASDKLLGSDTSYLKGDIAAYGIIPAFQANRLFLYGRGVMLSGQAFNQDRPGFARFDDLQITAPQFGLLAFSDAVRVRGFRKFVYGDRLLFGTAEYRMPFIPSLQTTLLGLVSLKSTTLSGFVDAGAVWEDTEILSKRVGVGAELKNAIVIGGFLQLMHAVGIAQPAPDFGTTDNYEVYYRIRAALPF